MNQRFNFKINTIEQNNKPHVRYITALAPDYPTALSMVRDYPGFQNVLEKLRHGLSLSPADKAREVVNVLMYQTDPDTNPLAFHDNNPYF